MDIKVIRFGYGWEWIGFFAISRPTCTSWCGVFLSCLSYRARQIPGRSLLRLDTDETTRVSLKKLSNNILLEKMLHISWAWESSPRLDRSANKFSAVVLRFKLPLPVSRLATS
jgi:hypothetical protein